MALYVMDFVKFEELQGMALGRFVKDAVASHQVDESLLDYLRSRRQVLDAQHLEMVIVMLGALGSLSALDQVAECLLHPTKSVRYQAAQTLNNARALGPSASAKIKEYLQNSSYRNDLVDLGVALGKK